MHIEKYEKGVFASTVPEYGAEIKSSIMEQPAKNNGVGMADVERVLGHKVDLTVSRDDKTMTACLNQGRPVVLAAGKSKLPPTILP